MHITFNYDRSAYYANMHLSNGKHELTNAKCIFDTGCSSSLLMCKSNVYQGLLKERFIQVTNEIKRSTGAAGTFDTRVCIIKKLELGDVIFSSLTTDIIVSDYDEPCMLLLGNDLINLFTFVNFNKGKSVILSTDEKYFHRIGSQRFKHMRLFG